MPQTTSTPKIRSALIFGAKDHIGIHVARYIQQRAPTVRLRVATHKFENIPALQKLLPNVEVVVADYFDASSMQDAVSGMEGIFQVSPDVFDEDTLVSNMVSACQQALSVRHIIRILGTPPGATMDMVSPALRQYRHYPAMQHLVATELYRAAGLPVTFVNVAGYYMDDFSRMFAQPLLDEQVIRVAFDKRLAWIDAQDVAEVSAELLLSEPSPYKGSIVDVTGNDLCKISTVADLFTEVLGHPVRYDGDEANFMAAITPVFSRLWGEQAPAYFLEYFKWETAHDHLFKLTPHVQAILGRPPKSFRAWIAENSNFFLQAWRNANVEPTL